MFYMSCTKVSYSLFSIICVLYFTVSDNPELCIVNSLVTPYFIPLLDTPRKARGCSVPSKLVTTRTHSTSQSHHLDKKKEMHVMAQNVHLMQEVHVIMLCSITDGCLGHHLRSHTPSPVKLIVNFSQGGASNESDAEVLGRLILVLYSDHPVAWEVVANYNNKEDANDDLYSLPQPLIIVSNVCSKCL